MKLYEKIRDIRQNKLKLTLRDFHKTLRDIFGKGALSYYSLCKVEKGHRQDIRLKSLYQICTGLGVSLRELKEGTDEEESKIVNIVRHSDRVNNRYYYSEKAIADILSSRNIKFLIMELLLKPGGITKTEEDPLDMNRFEKAISVLQGEVLCHIGSEKHLLKKGDTLSFASNIPHHFENPSGKTKARCMIVQNPKSY